MTRSTSCITTPPPDGDEYTLCEPLKPERRVPACKNTVIRKKLVELLNGITVLHGKSLVIRVDDQAVHIMGELDDHAQMQAISKLLAGCDFGRSVHTKLSIKPFKGNYRYQQRLL